MNKELKKSIERLNEWVRLNENYEGIAKDITNVLNAIKEQEWLPNKPYRSKDASNRLREKE